MCRIVIALVVVASCALCVSGPEAVSADQGREGRATVRVGTFEPRVVALAYYRSDLHEQRLAAVVAERQAAKASGDEQRARRLERERNAEQDLAHRQVFGTGPYDGLAGQLESVLRAVAKSEDVHVIAGQVAYAGPEVERVDVTEAILTELKTDEKTRKVIEDMRKKIDAGSYDPATYKGTH